MHRTGTTIIRRDDAQADPPTTKGRKRRRGPGSNPPILSPQILEDAYQALGRVMDAYAKAYQGAMPWDTYRAERRQLWATAQLLMRVAHRCYDEDGRQAPFLKEYHQEPGVTWFGDRQPRVCGRPTKKNQPCRVALKFGRIACHHHATFQELVATRRWQDAVHYPFPRAKVGRVLEIEKVQRQLIEVLKDLA